MSNIGHVISVGDVLATLCLRRVERLGDNFHDVSLPCHLLPLTAVGAMFVIMGMVGKLTGAVDQICGTLILSLTISLKTYSATHAVRPWGLW